MVQKGAADLLERRIVVEIPPVPIAMTVSDVPAWLLRAL
jgi:hypothetical protein